MNEKANHRSKVAVLSSIQKENKVIKLLQQENEDLKESLEEHQSVLEIIMSKYRQQMLQLIRLKKQQEISEIYFKSKIFQSLQEKTDQIAEMTEVMKKAIELDEKQVNENEEKLQSLLVENRGLKELLKIRVKYGGTTSLSKESPERVTNIQQSVLIDQEIQTDVDALLVNKTTEIIIPFQLDDIKNNVNNESLVSQRTEQSNQLKDDIVLDSKECTLSVDTTIVDQIEVSLDECAAAVEAVVVRIESADADI